MKRIGFVDYDLKEESQETENIQEENHENLQIFPFSEPHKALIQKINVLSAFIVSEDFNAVKEKEEYILSLSDSIALETELRVKTKLLMGI